MALQMPSDDMEAASWTEGESLRRERLDLGADFVEPLGETERWLAGVWRGLLKIDRIGAFDDFFELGGNSFQASELFLRIEQRTGVRLAHSTIIDHPTVAKLSTLLAGAKGSLAGRCLVPMQSEGAGPPLFFVHEVSGQVLAYRHLVKRLGAGRKIYGLQFPGQENARFPLLSIPEMAAIYVDAVRELQPHGPYFFAGYSLGGPVAYEMARQLRESGGDIRLLVLIDPAVNEGRVRGARRVARKLSYHLWLLSDADPVHWPRYLLGVLSKEFKRRPRPTAVRRDDGSPTLAEILHAAFESYRPPPYDGPTKLLRRARGLSYWNEKNLGWAAPTTSLIEICELPGDHIAIMSEPIVALIAAYIEKWLAEADATVPSAPGTGA